MAFNSSIVLVNFSKLKLQKSSGPMLYQIRFSPSSNSTDNSTHDPTLYSRKKFVADKKIFPKDRDSSPVVVKYEEASTVIKRFNWVNKQMFGPVQPTNTIKKTSYPQKIIQHETSIPILEPQSLSAANLLENNPKTDFDTLLKFPLFNKSGIKALSPNVNELNLLRQKLEGLTSSKMPSVTHILEKTMPPDSVERLEKWKQNMIDQLGEDGFEKYRKELFARGKSLHESINNFLISSSETEISIDENNLGHWKSLKFVFPQIKDVRLLEEKVSHPFLCYKGILDCFAQYKDHLVVIDWKTSKRNKSNLSNTYDNPLQIAAYVGALNFDPKFQYLVSKGLIVVAYETGAPATPLLIDEKRMTFYWKEWLKRVHAYWKMTAE